MTTLREAAQQALEALVHEQMGIAPPPYQSRKEMTDAAITTLKAALAEPVQEPVAWMDDSGHPKHIRHLQSVTERRLYGPLRPLYTTAPPQRKPLTEEEIRRIKPVSPDLVDFRSGVRCAERAHGIGEQK